MLYEHDFLQYHGTGVHIFSNIKTSKKPGLLLFFFDNERQTATVKCIWVLLTAAQLVGAVATVVVVVTHVLQGHAVPVGAFKLLQRAGRQRGLAACKGHNRRGPGGESSTQVRGRGRGWVETPLLKMEKRLWAVSTSCLSINKGCANKSRLPALAEYNIQPYCTITDSRVGTW